MRLEDYPDDDGRKVWLDRDEVGMLLDTDALEDRTRSTAVRPGIRTGLRSAEIIEVAPQDVVSHSGDP